MLEKMGFGEIRQDIKDNKKAKEKVIARTQRYNSYDSYPHQFGYTFASVLPKEYLSELLKKPEVDLDEYWDPFLNYLKDTLSKRPNKEHTAIEFGGPGSAILSYLGLKHSVGVCLEDIRIKSEKESDDMHGHSIVKADILDTKNEETYRAILSKIESKKTDIILSRVMGPLVDIAKNPLVLDRVIRKWYSLLNDNGVIIAQFDHFEQPFKRNTSKLIANDSEFKTEVQEDVEKWAEEIKKRFQKEIDIQVGRGVIRIYKKEGAPEELPRMKELFS